MGDRTLAAELADIRQRDSEWVLPMCLDLRETNSAHRAVEDRRALLAALDAATKVPLDVGAGNEAATLVRVAQERDESEETCLELAKSIGRLSADVDRLRLLVEKGASMLRALTTRPPHWMAVPPDCEHLIAEMEEAASQKISPVATAGSGGPATTGSAPERSPAPPPGETSGGSSAVTAGERRGAATALDLDAIRARADAATPGPWEAISSGGYGSAFIRWPGGEVTNERAMAMADARFAAAARSDVPALCDALRVARVPHMALLIEAARLTCGPDDEPTTASEKALVALDDAIDDALLDHLTTDRDRLRMDSLRCAVWQGLTDDIHPLHELVKVAGACVCPPEKPEAPCT